VNKIKYPPANYDDSEAWLACLLWFKS